MKIEKIAEYELSLNIRNALQPLLANSFPEHLSNRLYFKQVPQFRYLGWENATLVAQMGVEHRVIAIGKKPCHIFGVIDLCVRQDRRGNSIGTKLLNELCDLAICHDIDCILLFADNHRFYEKLGFKKVRNKCKWLGIDEHRTIGIIEDSLAECMMVKELKENVWSEDEVDLLGYLF